MNRLTDDNFRLGFDDSNKLPSYESIYERLRYYEKMEEQGKMLILPCKPGDTVYLLAKDAPKLQIIPHKVINLIYCVEIIPKIGKTAFLTEQEAQKALEGMKK